MIRSTELKVGETYSLRASSTGILKLISQAPFRYEVTTPSISYVKSAMISDKGKNYEVVISIDDIKTSAAVRLIWAEKTVTAIRIISVLPDPQKYVKQIKPNPLEEIFQWFGLVILAIVFLAFVYFTLNAIF